MKVQWKKLFFKATVWLAVEILLSLSGLDNLADYSEFFDQKVSVSQTVITELA